MVRSNETPSIDLVVKFIGELVRHDLGLIESAFQLALS